MSRRTREIGVRVALGGNRTRIIWGVFSRALKQIAMGIGVGAVLITVFMLYADGVSVIWNHGGIFLIYLLAMTLVCALACIVPTAPALPQFP